MAKIIFSPETITDKFYSTQEGGKLVRQGQIHGTLSNVRLTHLALFLHHFFTNNRHLVPAAFRDELASADLNILKTVAMMRASGRMGDDEEYTDHGRGINFCERGADKCRAYLEDEGLDAESAKQAAHAIIACEEEEPGTALGWLLKIATSMETCRDTRHKQVDITRFPCWALAKTVADKKQIRDLILNHYSLIITQQGFANVDLVEGEQSLFRAGDSPRIPTGKDLEQVDALGKEKDCFDKVGWEMSSYYELRYPHLMGYKPDLNNHAVVKRVRRSVVKYYPNLSARYALKKKKSYIIEDNIERGIVEGKAAETLLEPHGYIALHSAQKTESILISIIIKALLEKLGPAQGVSTKLNRMPIPLADQHLAQLIDAESEVCAENRRLIAGYRFVDKGTSAVAVAASSTLTADEAGESVNAFLRPGSMSALQGRGYVNFRDILSQILQSPPFSWDAPKASLFVERALNLFDKQNSVPESILQTFWFKRSDKSLHQQVVATLPYGDRKYKDVEQIYENVLAQIVRKDPGDQFRVLVNKKQISSRFYGGKRAAFLDFKSELKALLEMAEKPDCVMSWQREEILEAINAHKLNKALDLIKSFEEKYGAKFEINDIATFISMTRLLIERDINPEHIQKLTSRLSLPLLNEPQIKKDGDTALIWAVYHYRPNRGFSKLIDQILETEALDINATNKLGYSALFYATRKNASLVKRLLEKGAAPDFAQDGHMTPWQMALKKGQPAIITTYLDHFSKQKNYLDYFKQALQAAEKEGNAEHVKKLIIRANTEGHLLRLIKEEAHQGSLQSAILACASSLPEEVITYLIENNPDRQFIDSLHISKLLQAGELEDACKHIIEYEKKHQAAFQVASVEDLGEIIFNLSDVERDADIELLAKVVPLYRWSQHELLEGETVITYLAQAMPIEKQHAHFLDSLLKQHPVDVDAKNRRNQTELFAVTEQRNEKWVAHYLAQGADPYETRADCPFTKALRTQKFSLVKVYLDHFAAAGTLEQAMEQAFEEVIDNLFYLNADYFPSLVQYAFDNNQLENIINKPEDFDPLALQKHMSVEMVLKHGDLQFKRSYLENAKDEDFFVLYKAIVQSREFAETAGLDNLLEDINRIKHPNARSILYNELEARTRPRVRKRFDSRECERNLHELADDYTKRKGTCVEYLYRSKIIRGEHVRQLQTRIAACRTPEAAQVLLDAAILKPEFAANRDRFRSDSHQTRTTKVFARLRGLI